jgi:Ca2+-binding EF-hand superfamily protein
MDALDADKDGKVTPAELSAYYRKHGYSPFQVRVASSQPDPISGFAALYGAGRAEPSVSAVAEAVFARIDTNKDGKLTKEKLVAATAALLTADEDEDEIVTPHELVPPAAPSAGMYDQMMAMGRPGGRTEPAAKNGLLLPVVAPGEAPEGLVLAMQERYGPKSDKPEGKKLSRKDVGLAEADFAKLDANGDGVLDAAELAAFVKRAPDLELVVRLGKKETADARLSAVSAAGKPAPLADKLAIKDAIGMLDLGVTRAELRIAESEGPDPFSAIRAQQMSAQFKQADANNDGVIDAKEAENSRAFRGTFKAMDRDGDGKLTEKEMNAYLDHLKELQKQAATGCVSLTLTDQSRGLFDLLDANRDSRLSVREMRQAPKLLERLDRDNKGYLTREDIPRSYQLAVRRGPSSAGNAADPAALFTRYLAPQGKSEPEGPTAGPLWFRKMDRNRDGDVSRKEFLFGEEAFRRLDTDGDGLISLEEAEKTGR